MENSREAATLALALVVTAVGACAGPADSGGPNGTTAARHLSFPIAQGATHALGRSVAAGAIACASCHEPSAPTFKEFSCVGCHEHEQPVTDRLHVSVADYTYTSAGCLKCHPASDKNQFDHKGISEGCALCHDTGTVFAALPVAGFTHPSTGGADCSGCHVTTTWKGATGGPTKDTHDPAHDLIVNALIPMYTGTSLTSLSPRAETLHMSMNHLSKDVPAAALGACGNCHPSGGANAVLPGTLHASLTALTLPQPTACASCHTDAAPVGFVGPTAAKPARVPASGEMKHDAVAWANGAPTATKLVGTDCGACHASPAVGRPASWTVNPTATGPAQYHAALDAAKAAQPGACFDCHANNLPAGLTSTTTKTSASAASGVAAGTPDQISHADANVTGRDCNFCHTQVGFSRTGATGDEWSQARFHASFASASSPLVLDARGGRCSNCHLNVKPSAGATSQDHASFTNAPGSEDCSSCHTFPGTGTQAAPNWLGASGVPVVITVGGFQVSQPPATSVVVQAGIAMLPHPTSGNGAACTTCHAEAGGGRMAKGYDHLSTLIKTNCNSCHEAGSDLVATPWNGATTAATGAGDTRPSSIVGLVPAFKGNTRALTNDFKHFYPADCRECHVVPAGTGPVTMGAAYKAAWKFNHKESQMAKSTCNMCHGSPNNLPGD